MKRFKDFLLENNSNPTAEQIKTLHELMGIRKQYHIARNEYMRKHDLFWRRIPDEHRANLDDLKNEHIERQRQIVGDGVYSAMLTMRAVEIGRAHV